MASPSHLRTYEWPHSLAEVMTALLDAGLPITSFDEQQTVPRRAHPFMEPTGERWAFTGSLREAVPLTSSITAVKEG